MTGDIKVVKTLNQLRDEAHANSVSKGFWEEIPDFAKRVSLMHSELSEALEADRKGVQDPNMDEFKRILDVANPNSFDKLFKAMIKDTPPDELADTIIRILDHCGKEQIDI